MVADGLVLHCEFKTNTPQLGLLLANRDTFLLVVYGELMESDHVACCVYEWEGARRRGTTESMDARLYEADSVARGFLLFRAIATATHQAEGMLVGKAR